MLRARARGDADRARRRRRLRRLPARARAVRVRAADARFEGEVSGVIGARRLRPLRRRARRRLRGLPAGAADRGASARARRDRDRARRHGAAARPGPARATRSTVRVDGVEAAARAGRPAAGRGRRPGDEQARQAQGRPPATSRPTAAPAHATSWSSASSAGSSSSAREVKSLRDGKAQIGDAYAAIEDGEVWLRGAHIPPYAPASIENHEPERPRKLLLHRYEIERLIGRIAAQGPDPGPDADLLQGPAGEGRARARPRQGAARPPARDPRPRHPARGRARAARPPALARPRPRPARLEPRLEGWSTFPPHAGVQLQPPPTRARTPRAASARPRCGSGTPAPRARGGSSGTSPTTAIVAACSDSATSGPTKVAPTITRGPRRRRAARCRGRCGRRSSPRRCAAVAHVDGAGAASRARARLASVSPTAATCGSVNTTRGEPGLVGGRARRPCRGCASAQIRAWYLPMWVSSARPLTSPIAYSHSEPPTRSWSSTSR